MNRKSNKQLKPIEKMSDAFTNQKIIVANDCSILASIDDIEQHSVYEALQDSEKRYRRLFESAKDGILILDANSGKIVDANPFLLELIGHSLDSIMEKYIWEIGLFKDIACSKEAFKVLQSKEYIRYDDLPLLAKGGRIVPVEFISNVYLVDHKKVIQCNIRDITERKDADIFIQIRLNLMKFAFDNPMQTVLQQALDELCEITGSTLGTYYFVSVGEKILTLKGWASDTPQYFCNSEAINEMVFHVDNAAIWTECVRERHPIIHNDYISLPCFGELSQRHIASIRELGVPIIRQGHIVAILVIGNKPQGYTVKDVQIAAYFADLAWEIAEHKQVEEALRQSEEKFRTYTENAPLGIFVADEKGKYIEVNLAACQMTGYSEEELLRLTIPDFLAPEFMSDGLTILKIATTEGFAEGEVMVRNKKGENFWIDLLSVKLKDNSIIAFGSCK